MLWFIPSNYEVREEHMVRWTINGKKYQGNLMIFGILMTTEISFTYLSTFFSIMYARQWKEKSKHEVYILLLS